MHGKTEVGRRAATDRASYFFLLLTVYFHFLEGWKGASINIYPDWNRLPMVLVDIYFFRGDLLNTFIRSFIHYHFCRHHVLYSSVVYLESPMCLRWLILPGSFLPSKATFHVPLHVALPTSITPAHRINFFNNKTTTHTRHVTPRLPMAPHVSQVCLPITPEAPCIAS
jgi:hypothetical protein